MDKVDLMAAVLIAVSCFMVYGSGRIIKLVRAKGSDSQHLTVKLIGLAVGAAGCLRIIGIF